MEGSESVQLIVLEVWSNPDSVDSAAFSGRMLMLMTRNSDNAIFVSAIVNPNAPVEYLRIDYSHTISGIWN